MRKSPSHRMAYGLIAASLLLGGTAAASPPAVPESGPGLQAMAKDQPFVTVPIETLKPAQAMEKPVLTPSGGQLILSDSPEMPTTPGAYYRDRVNGSFRIFYHHLNNTGAPLQIGAAVTNTAGYTVKLYEEGSGAGVDYYPDVAGQLALAAFLKDRGVRKPIAVLKPGETYWRTVEVAPTHTVSGFLQLRAESAPGGLAPVTVTTLGYAERPVNPLAETVLPPDRHIRGTFPHYDRSGTLVYRTSAGNSLLRVDSSPTGQWADFMPGEYEPGVDAISGATVLNPGNYGVIYDMSVQIENDSDERRSVGVYLNPSGGSGHFTIGWGGKLLNSGFLNYTMAWQLSEFNVGRKGKTVPSRLSLTGGSAGPQTLYFTNSSLK